MRKYCESIVIHFWNNVLWSRSSRCNIKFGLWPKYVIIQNSVIEKHKGNALSEMYI